MKRMKKLFGVLVAMVMIMSMSLTALATDITMDGTGAVYEAYRLLDATDGGDGKYAYTVNDKYATVLQNVTGKTGKAVVDYISTLNSTAIQKFANDVYTELTSISADYTADDNVFESVAEGYYLIAEVTTDGTQDTYSLVMLKTAGNTNITVETKEDKPTLNKEIQHNESGKWGNVGDNQIGDTVNFRLIVTVPDFTEDYSTYVYTIHDTMSAGLTSNVVNDSSVVIKKHNSDADVLSDTYYDVIVDPLNPNEFDIAIDVKKAVEENVMHHGHSLYIYYSAVLNKDALVYNEGKQWNEAELEYSNNPYDTTETTKTEKDIVYDWTFEMDVEKIDGAETDPAKMQISGAKFVLSYNGTLDVPEYVELGNTVDDTAGLIGVVEEAAGQYRIAAPGEVCQYVMDAGKFSIGGLDDSEYYYLYEVKAPDGYNKLEQPVRIEIQASYNDAGDAYTAVAASVNGGKAGALSTQVINNAGLELPTTGGIGTHWFYVIGGVLLAGAVVVFVTRRRMNVE